MKLIFVHGWSVTHTNTYRDLPQTIADQGNAHGLSIDIDHIHLGKYISFHDEVSLDDIARAMDQALRELPGNHDTIAPFSCITHSTGGPVVRYWAEKFYGHSELANMPLRHLVMLAPANHGSSLAALGQKRVSRIKSWFSGVEPGQRVLDWLRLGSVGQRKLNGQALAYRYGQQGFYPFVITGQGIDTKAYDFLNNYLVEKGSDGVIRVAGANLNCRFISLQQTSQPVRPQTGSALALAFVDGTGVQATAEAPLAVLSDASHSGSKMGILSSRHKSDVHQHVAEKIFQCLTVENEVDYQTVVHQWQQFTDAQQQKIPQGKKEKISRYGMLVFRVKDSSGDVIAAQDCDILLLAGSKYSPNELPSGFFVDRQVNTDSQALIYYVDIDKMLAIKDGAFGVAVVARPEQGFSYYRHAEFHADPGMLSDIFVPNQTTYIDISLERFVDKNVFRFDRARDSQTSFKNVKPMGDDV